MSYLKLTIITFASLGALWPSAFLLREDIGLVPKPLESRVSTHGDEDLVVEAPRQILLENACHSQSAYWLHQSPKTLPQRLCGIP